MDYNFKAMFIEKVERKKLAGRLGNSQKKDEDSIGNLLESLPEKPSTGL